MSVPADGEANELGRVGKPMAMMMRRLRLRWRLWRMVRTGPGPNYPTPAERDGWLRTQDQLLNRPQRIDSEGIGCGPQGQL